MADLRSSTSRFPGPLAGALGLAALVALTGCGSGGGGGGAGGGQSGIVGAEEAKPGGGTFFVDPNGSGSKSRLQLAEMFWGRLVDVHDLAVDGSPNAQPIFRDLIINENVQTDGINYQLETNPITQKTRLIILRTRGLPHSQGTWDSLFTAARANLPPVIPKAEAGSPPFSFLARNACLALRFDDCLDDSLTAQQRLVDTVKVLVGYPPSTPFAPRILFDPNHGARVGGQFHSTRILIDMTVSETEAGDMLVPQPINSIGLPASLTTTNLANVSVHLPTRTDFGSGQFYLLTNLAGSPLSTTKNGPIASNSTMDVVRAMRAGNSDDRNNGFLLDLNSPEVLGGWPVQISGVVQDPLGEAGFDFLIDVQFLSPCLSQMEPGDIVSVGSSFLEVREVSAAPFGGAINAAMVRSLATDPITSPSVLFGAGLFLSTLDPSLAVPTGCWLEFSPQPAILPATGVMTQAQVLARFSEPMDPASVTAFETMLVIRGDSSVATEAENIVVGNVTASPDLKEFTFTPLLPFQHQSGLADGYHVVLGDVTDLGGNLLERSLATIDFTIDASEPGESNGGVVMRFSGTDEVKPLGGQDVRGQIFYDLGNGLIRPRPVTFEGFPADRSNPVPSIMIPISSGVQTPLSPFGSRLQTVWRYCDLGWQVRDESKYNVDVYGLNWSPIGGQVLSDFYEEFEVALAHSLRMPDEAIDNNLLPANPNSGLSGSFFDDNILKDPLSPQKIVHPRALGYIINPADRFQAATGTFLVPFPVNRMATQGSLVTYTWRDTAALRKGAPGGKGIPLDIEVGSPLGLEQGIGCIAQEGQVPTFGLPLLLEYRCYPSDSAVGLNSLDISIAINSSALPNFRAYSTGGTNVSGQGVFVNPDTEDVPMGGFNPNSNPPGKRTQLPASNEFYIGQLDAVIRISRAHTAWIDTVFNTPDFLDPVVDPDPALQPFNTQVIVDFRGATGFTGLVNPNDPLDAQNLDPYGELDKNTCVGGTVEVPGTVNYLNANSAWYSDIDSIDGSRYLQMRLTFISNIETLLTAQVSAIGVAFRD
jgi:hypothetical protein